MEERKQFRTASFGGFHRQDVIDYIEAVAKENQSRQAELESQLNEAQTQLSDLMFICQELDDTKAELTRLKEDTAKQALDFERQKQAYVDIELAAHRRAAALEDEAKAEHDRVIAQAQAEAETIIAAAEAQAQQRTQALQEEIARLEAQRLTLLRDSRSELNKNATALKANVSISLEELDRLRGTLEALSSSFDGSIAALDAVCGEEA